MNLLEKGIDFIRLDQLDEAEEYFTSLIIDYPENDGIYRFLSMIKDKKNLHSESIYFAQKAILINNKQPRWLWKILFENITDTYNILDAKNLINANAYEKLSDFIKIKESLNFEDYNESFNLGKNIMFNSIKNKKISFISPYNGEIISSNKTICELAYYFKSNEGDFILSFFDDWAKDFYSFQIYFIDKNLLIYGSLNEFETKSFNPFSIYYADVYCILKTYSEKIKVYLNMDDTIKILVKNLNLPHLGHTIWNSLSVWEDIQNFEYKKNIDNIIIENGTIPPNLITLKLENIKQLFSNNFNSIHDFIFDNNYFLITLKDHFIHSSIGHTIIKNSFKTLDDLYFKKVCDFRKQHFPILLISLRFGTRMWIEQDVGLEKIIYFLEKKYPNIGFVIDGMNSSKLESNKSHKNINLEEEINFSNKFINKKNVIISVGEEIEYSFVWSEISDLILSPWGAGLSKYKWINNKKSIVYSSKCVLNEKKDLHIYDSALYRENAVTDIWIDSAFSSNNQYKDINEYKSKVGNNFDGYYYQNYSLNWEILLSEIINQFEKLLPERNNIIDNQMKGLGYIR